LDELTAPLLMLASDAGSFINGAAIPVDGGHLVSSL
jgi:NAD(P)-dependent dehydrogenase (short-subunit alcohol dehydrogenase family)